MEAGSKCRGGRLACLASAPAGVLRGCQLPFSSLVPALVALIGPQLHLPCCGCDARIPNRCGCTPGYSSTRTEASPIPEQPWRCCACSADMEVVPGPSQTQQDAPPTFCRP
ncbi:hypothetical protein NDU88_003232 [Pleurodeles waltl]|uniref:Uncharacterized protein n=1 Tax=Pleurodeles waltl TaxID=8319 RepID=A0AAV7M2U6_PLEWA|nr:hypothetical protein NDU88_003232 [Pleurodeles waltl]